MKEEREVLIEYDEVGEETINIDILLDKALIFQSFF
jgi:hypothetical protein